MPMDSLPCAKTALAIQDEAEMLSLAVMTRSASGVGSTPMVSLPSTNMPDQETRRACRIIEPLNRRHDTAPRDERRGKGHHDIHDERNQADIDRPGRVTETQDIDRLEPLRDRETRT